MSGTQAIVMVVEDDLDVCDSLEAIVQASGHVCHTFDSAEALLRLWDGSNCDILIVDVDLPEMDGIELLTQLRACGYSTPAIIHTGRSDSRVRKAAQELGAVPVVVKGTDNNRIGNLLRSIVSSLQKPDSTEE